MLGSLHFSAVLLGLVVIVASPIITFQSLTPDEQRAEPADDSQPAKDTPRERFALRLDVDGDGEQPTGNERTDTTPSSRQRLGDAVQRAQTGV